jgi:uncharacterized protein (DUF4415 family)
MSDKPIIFDEDNPEWTEEDFARALRGDDIPAHIRAAFPPRRGEQKSPTKEQVSIRLDRDVLERLRATGPGWQSRVNAILRKAVA